MYRSLDTTKLRDCVRQTLCVDKFPALVVADPSLKPVRDLGIEIDRTYGCFFGHTRSDLSATIDIVAYHRDGKNGEKTELTVMIHGTPQEKSPAPAEPVPMPSFCTDYETNGRLALSIPLSGTDDCDDDGWPEQIYTEHQRSINSITGKMFVGTHRGYRDISQKKGTWFPVSLNKDIIGRDAPRHIGEVIAFRRDGKNTDWKDHVVAIAVILAFDADKVSPAKAVDTVLKNLSYPDREEEKN